jgi:hypothetical protein
MYTHTPGPLKKRPIIEVEETYYRSKRDPAHSKETYYRSTHTPDPLKTRPTIEVKETYYRSKRDLL